MHKNRKHHIYTFDESLAVDVILPFYSHELRYSNQTFGKSKAQFFSIVHFGTFNRNERNAFYFNSSFLVQQ